MSGLDLSAEPYRYERKFLVPASARHRIDFYVRRNCGMFSPVFQPRVVNNLYLDNAALDCFFMNINGESRRTKIRIRWYGQLFGHIPKPVLEFKIKNGLLGTKRSFALKPFLLDQTFHARALNRLIQDSDLPPQTRLQLNRVEPALLNRYQRKYFESADRRFRITVDSDLEFLRVRSTHNLFALRNRSPHHVLELKYDRAHSAEADDISNGLPFRAAKMSKYVVGLESLDGY